MVEVKAPDIKRGERVIRLFYPSGIRDFSFGALDELPALFERNALPAEELQRAIIYARTPPNSIAYREPVYEQDPHAEKLLKKLGLLKKPNKTKWHGPAKVKEKDNLYNFPVFDGDSVIFPDGLSYSFTELGFISLLPVKKFVGTDAFVKRSLHEIMKSAEKYGANLVVLGNTRQSKGFYMLYKISNPNILEKVIDYTVERLKSRLESKV